MIERALGIGVVATGLLFGGWLFVPGGSNAGAGPVPGGPRAPVVRMDLPEGALAQRPLFDMSRRPVIQEAEPVPVPAAPEPVRISLSGIVGAEEEGFTALFRVSNRAEIKIVRPGGSVEGWSIQEIGADHVTMTDREGETRRLPLR